MVIYGGSYKIGTSQKVSNHGNSHKEDIAAHMKKSRVMSNKISKAIAKPYTKKKSSEYGCI